ncbi:hypothetical protein J4D99_07715 [Siccationidurans ginsengisoli]|uniref:hypothetical protein n=1 Tax=Hymenobacter TaxID=89966 RepID=UPI001AAE0662|nr:MULTISPECIES: hypothetical protein [unclassified Hymenobacter]MBO2031272.1 hypothetical protein [Hymenobacter sp. BT559]
MPKRPKPPPKPPKHWKERWSPARAAEASGLRGGAAYFCWPGRLLSAPPISYPLYITHYRLVYVYTGWVSRHKVPLAPGLPWTALTFAVAAALAYACLNFYDEPVRRWLRQRVLARS